MRDCVRSIRSPEGRTLYEMALVKGAAARRSWPDRRKLRPRRRLRPPEAADLQSRPNQRLQFSVIPQKSEVDQQTALAVVAAACVVVRRKRGSDSIHSIPRIEAQKIRENSCLYRARPIRPVNLINFCQTRQNGIGGIQADDRRAARHAQGLTPAKV